METRAHHVLIGAFTIGAFLVALGFVLWMSKSGTERAFDSYDIVFTEAVTGLSVGGLVQYNGIKVGEVSALQLAKDDPRKVIARIRVDSGTPVNQDTRAKLGLQGVTGLAFIQLSGGKPGSPPLQRAPGHDVPEITAEESALSRLLDSGSDVVTSINEILLRINDVLSEQNIASISSTLENVELLTGALADQRDDMGQALGQLADATAQLKETLATVDTMATETSALMRNDARAVLASTREALDSVNRLADSAGTLIDDNRAAIDSFSNQGLRQIGPTVAELRQTLLSLKQLSDRLGDSNSLLLGRDQPKEFQPQ